MDEVTQTPAGAARGTTLARFGLLMAAAGPLLMLSAAIAWGLDLSGTVVFFLLSAGVPVVAALLVRRPGTVTKIFAIVAAFLLMAAMFWTVFGFFAPASFFDFVPGVLVLPGALIAIANAVRAIGAGKRGVVVPPSEPRTARTIAFVVGALMLASAIMTITGRTSVPAGTATAVTIRQKDFDFDRPEYRIGGGSVIRVKNADPFLHTFTVDPLGLDLTLNPGSEATVTLPSQAGEYILYCRPHTSNPKSPAADDMAARLFIT